MAVIEFEVTPEESELALKILRLHTYDAGCKGSGLKDDGFKAEAKAWDTDKLYRILAICCVLLGYPPYSFEDIHTFVKWVEALSGLDIDWM